MKKILFTCIFVILILYSFLFPEITVNAAKNGIQIWFNQILPSLLPFTILSNILVKSNFLKSFHGNENIISIILTMICGFVFGFPIGAKLSADFHKQKLLSTKQATLLAIATNNFSPMYVCGFALPFLFDSANHNKITYVFLYLLPLLIVTFFLLFDASSAITKQEPYSANENNEMNLHQTSQKNRFHKKSTSRFHLNMQIMDAGIISGFESLIKICGYIVIFSIAAEMLTNLWNNPPFLLNMLLGNLEITNGIQMLSAYNIAENTKYILAIQLLSFGGLSGIAQTSSILADSGLSIRKYIIGKAVLSLFLTLLCVIYVFFIHSL